MALECHHCHAEIIKVELQQSDRLDPEHPVNPASIGQRGKLALRKDDRFGLWFARRLNQDNPLRPGEQQAQSHYATCTARRSDSHN